MTDLQQQDKLVTVEICGLKRHFGDVKAVDGIDFSFVGGHVHGFIGPNGAGKTTTMRILATLDFPTGGDVLIDGISALHFPDMVRPRIGFMPDYLDSYHHMSVCDYLDFYARAYGLKNNERKERLNAVIDFTGLNKLLQRPVDRLSKGEKQRISLSRMLINNPDVLILDEPAAGLDPRARVELRRLVRQLADKGKAVFISSHILTELSEICDAVTIIESGKIRASDAVKDIQKKVDAGTRVAIQLEDATESERERLTVILSELSPITKIEESPNGAVFSYEGDSGFRSTLLALLIEKRFKITDFHAATSDLEDAFLNLTERESRV